MNNKIKKECLIAFLEILRLKEMEIIDNFKSCVIMLDRESEVSDRIANRQIERLSMRLEQQGQRMLNFSQEIKSL